RPYLQKKKKRKKMAYCGHFVIVNKKQRRCRNKALQNSTLCFLHNKKPSIKRLSKEEMDAMVKAALLTMSENPEKASISKLNTKEIENARKQAIQASRVNKKEVKNLKEIENVAIQATKKEKIVK